MELILALANILIAISMVVTGYSLWKNRRYRFLKGGDTVVLITLLILSLDYGLTAVGISALRPFLLPILAGLSVTSAAVVCSFARVNNDQKAELCILSKEGRRYCHLAMLAKAVNEDEISESYVSLVDAARNKRAESIKDAG